MERSWFKLAEDLVPLLIWCFFSDQLWAVFWSWSDQLVLIAVSWGKDTVFFPSVKIVLIISISLKLEKENYLRVIQSSPLPGHYYPIWPLPQCSLPMRECHTSLCSEEFCTGLLQVLLTPSSKKSIQAGRWLGATLHSLLSPIVEESCCQVIHPLPRSQGSCGEILYA